MKQATIKINFSEDVSDEAIKQIVESFYLKNRKEIDGMVYHGFEDNLNIDNVYDKFLKNVNKIRTKKWIKY